MTAIFAIDADALEVDPLWLVGRLREGHRQGIGTVERLLLEEPGAANSLLTWVAWQPGAALGAKLATVFPGNEARAAGPNIRSIVVLFDGQNGRPQAVITGESFTRAKTAADSALGADLLARLDATALAVLGAGAQAETQIRYLLAVRPSIRRVAIWNRTAEKAQALVASLRFPGVEIGAIEDAEAAVRQADIVCCVTASRDPVLHGAWLKPGAHVDLVGSFTPEMREADDAAMRRARLFVDTRRFAIGHCGEFTQAIAAGAIAAADVAAELAELCAGAPGRRSADEITLFKNAGGGHLDLMIAQALYDLAAGGA
ncbi:ornithine cyclodeaminase family protein [Inquilinus sp. Marseille-Q2685]|uniref:ornithine cyclodeaminase family protein n=1 Tax=Inquilinus sp. Marseille-Q2685 TaxID=2866581 RepID=UPI001CE4AD70|nr:ornithine cyclodeaminase [Inquilinus sp. Marseille-Q2685]